MMTQTCRGCGQPLAAGVGFCPNCGVRSEGNGSAYQTPTQPMTVAPVTASVTPVAQMVTEPVPQAPVTPAGNNNNNKVLTWVAGGVAALMIAGAAAFALRPTPAQGDVVAQGPIGPQ